MPRIFLPFTILPGSPRILMRCLADAEPLARVGMRLPASVRPHVGQARRCGFASTDRIKKGKAER
ncbi:MAG: hypothetical protein NTY37_03215 [Methanothrix sp.]|nr:hypothetical protein [Methanothrix sp.]